MNITVLKNEIDYTSSSILLTFESVYAKTSLRKAGKQQMSFTMIFGYIHTCKNVPLQRNSAFLGSSTLRDYDCF